MEIIAHRCLKNSFKANSIEAFKKCLSIDEITGIEIDICESKNDELVVAHPKYYHLVNNYKGLDNEADDLSKYFALQPTKNIYLHIKGFGKYAIRKLYKLEKFFKQYKCDTSKIRLLSYEKSVLSKSKEIFPNIPTVQLRYINFNKDTKISDMSLCEFSIQDRNKIHSPGIIGSWFPKRWLNWAVEKNNHIIAIMFNSNEEIVKFKSQK